VVRASRNLLESLFRKAGAEPHILPHASHVFRIRAPGHRRQRADRQTSA